MAHAQPFTWTSPGAMTLALAPTLHMTRVVAACSVKLRPPVARPLRVTVPLFVFLIAAVLPALRQTVLSAVQSGRVSPMEQVLNVPLVPVTSESAGLHGLICPPDPDVPQ